MPVLHGMACCIAVGAWALLLILHPPARVLWPGPGPGPPLQDVQAALDDGAPLADLAPKLRLGLISALKGYARRGSEEAADLFTAAGLLAMEGGVMDKVAGQSSLPPASPLRALRSAQSSAAHGAHALHALHLARQGKAPAPPLPC